MREWESLVGREKYKDFMGVILYILIKEFDFRGVI